MKKKSIDAELELPLRLRILLRAFMNDRLRPFKRTCTRCGGIFYVSPHDRKAGRLCHFCTETQQVAGDDMNVMETASL